MQLKLPPSLHYPITVTELLRRPNDNVERLAPLFSYFYMTTVLESNLLGEKKPVQKTFPTRYESPVDGVLKLWNIKAGAVITASNIVVAEIEEPCSHSVQFGGMCTICGKDMTAISYNTDMSDSDRATIHMVHDNNALTVSTDEATRLEQEARLRLLKTRKLSLVVDLDQTIIHATVDPTVAEWQNDPSNPNYDAVKDVRVFQLVDDGPGARGCSYYIKLRPGLGEFLKSISKTYELHIYTMGTRAYAQNIAAIVDPERSIFGDRILSRDESGSLTAKNLQRLFPTDTKMVVIIDDRGDVWKWSENLIKVTAYDFFVGIGDINSSFLPKKPELQPEIRALPSEIPKPNNDLAEGAQLQEPEPAEERPAFDTSSSEGAPEQPDLESKNDVSTLEQLVSMGGSDDPTVLQQQTSKQDEALIAQLHDRPLLQKQKRLDAEDLAASESVDSSTNDDVEHNSLEHPPSDDNMSESGKPRHNLLHDDDSELLYLEQSLMEVHRVFYEEYDRSLAQVQGGRLAELRGEKNSKRRNVKNELEETVNVPDIKYLLPLLKLRVLDGVNIVFSGVVPIGTDVQASDIGLWAKSFGARVHEDINKRTTHVVAARNRTAKVKQAARRHRIKIVFTQWLLDSISQWQRLDEDPYLIPVHPEDREPHSSSNGVISDKDDSPEDVAAEPENLMLSSSEDDLGGASEDESMHGDKDEVDDPESAVPDAIIDPFENYDREGVDEELKEFLGSDGEDSDSDSVMSDSSQGSSLRKKRKRPSPSSSESGSDSDRDRASNAADESKSGSRLAKRQQLARDRTTTLKAVATANELGSVPAVAGAEERDEDQDNNHREREHEGEESENSGNGENAEDGEESGPDEMERELAAELEKELGNDGNDFNAEIN
ncbi:MAG: Carboxy-terminal domain (CTD) phosphatase [Sclerophora amabilis]|nr:MAG: Carboxy-terminal domain (CTD) phosphatase [Sclerophora amabilis]